MLEVRPSPARRRPCEEVAQRYIGSRHPHKRPRYQAIESRPCCSFQPLFGLAFGDTAGLGHKM